MGWARRMRQAAASGCGLTSASAVRGEAGFYRIAVAPPFPAGYRGSGGHAFSGPERIRGPYTRAMLTRTVVLVIASGALAACASERPTTNRAAGVESRAEVGRA